MQQLIRLPYPPSANALSKNIKRGGRARTPEYDAWIAEAGWALTSQHPKSILGSVKIFIVAVRPDNRRRDVANLEKPIVDLLVRHGIIEDDSHVESLTLEWAYSDSLRGVSVSIAPSMSARHVETEAELSNISREHHQQQPRQPNNKPKTEKTDET